MFSFQFLFIVHVCLCALLVFLVMLQQGKGADAGAITGGGGGNSIFGPGGAGSVMTRVTTGLAIVFMLSSILLVKSYNSASFKGAVDAQPSDLLKGSVMLDAMTAPDGTDVPVAEDEQPEGDVDQAAPEVATPVVGTESEPEEESQK